MCVTTILRSVEDGRGQKSYRPIGDEDYPICLLGKFCDQIKHRHFILQDSQTERCAVCDKEAIQTALWSAGGGIPISADVETNGQVLAQKGHFVLKQINTTVQQELSKALEEDLPIETLKAIEHYFFGLPALIDKGPLVDIFGERVGACESDIEHYVEMIASRHLFRREMVYALGVGRETWRRQRKGHKLKRMSAASGLRELRLQDSDSRDWPGED
ncbi:hypothetical protein GGR57DRAFT_369347 [Xylariaceae sp. FL1272]|nr:hypothetical protein GGR57DRAFT_369347 [Xylariaceae sp. FL1272]